MSHCATGLLSYALFWRERRQWAWDLHLSWGVTGWPNAGEESEDCSISVRIHRTPTPRQWLYQRKTSAFFRECHYIVKTSFIPPIIPHEKIFKYKWHNNNQIHLALHFHKNNSGNVGFRWHLGARGVEERGEMEEKKMLLKSYATLSLRSLIFHPLQMLANLWHYTNCISSWQQIETYCYRSAKYRRDPLLETLRYVQ